MWVTLGRFYRNGGASDDATLARTLRAIADGADMIPGHVSTRLFATGDRRELFCSTHWELESSAQTYTRILKEHPEMLAIGYQAEIADFTLLEEITDTAPKSG